MKQGRSYAEPLCWSAAAWLDGRFDNHAQHGLQRQDWCLPGPTKHFSACCEFRLILRAIPVNSNIDLSKRDGLNEGRPAQGNDSFLTVTTFDKVEALTTLRADRLSISMSQTCERAGPQARTPPGDVPAAEFEAQYLPIAQS